MTKHDVLKEVQGALEIKVPLGDLEKIFAAYESVVKTTLATNPEEKVPMIGFGNFTVKHVPAKSGVSVLGGAEKAWSTPEHDEITFKLTKSAKAL